MFKHKNLQLQKVRIIFNFYWRSTNITRTNIRLLWIEILPAAKFQIGLWFEQYLFTVVIIVATSGWIEKNIAEMA